MSIRSNSTEEVRFTGKNKKIISHEHQVELHRRSELYRSWVSICTFVPVKQVNVVPASSPLSAQLTAASVFVLLYQ